MVREAPRRPKQENTCEGYWLTTSHLRGLAHTKDMQHNLLKIIYSIFRYVDEYVLVNNVQHSFFQQYSEEMVLQ